MIINAVTGGGGDTLKLDIVTGETPPTSAKSGTLWVGTTETIPSWFLSPEQPLGPRKGELLLVTADEGEAFDFGRKNRALLYLAFASIYNGKAWQPVDARVYGSSSWLPISKPVVYKDGYGWYSLTQKVVSGTMSAGEKAITVKTNGGKAGEAYAMFGPLTLSGVTTISMRAKSTDKNKNVYFALMIAKGDATRTTAELKTETEITDNEEHIITLDVSGKSGNGWYIFAGINTAGGAWSNARTANVTEVALDELV